MWKEKKRERYRNALHYFYTVYCLLDILPSPEKKQNIQDSGKVPVHRRDLVGLKMFVDDKFKKCVQKIYEKILTIKSTRHETDLFASKTVFYFF